MSLILYQPSALIEQIEVLRTRFDAMQEMMKKVMVKNIHYGEPYGGAGKPTLLKPGAEVVTAAFQLYPEFEAVSITEDFASGVFHYRYKCTLKAIGTGQVVATGIGSCNSREEKYAYNWVYKSAIPQGMNPDDLPKKEYNGKNGKYLKYRIVNPDIYSLVNTIDKMAQKRSFIAAVLIATGASALFTQDVEDLPDYGNVIIEGVYEDATDEPPAKPKNGNGHDTTQRPPSGSIAASDTQLADYARLMVKVYGEDYTEDQKRILGYYNVVTAAALTLIQMDKVLTGLRSKLAENAAPVESQPAPDEKPALPAMKTANDLAAELEAAWQKLYGNDWEVVKSDFLTTRKIKRLAALSRIELGMAIKAVMDQLPVTPAALTIE